MARKFFVGFYTSQGQLEMVTDPQQFLADVFIDEKRNVWHYRIGSRNIGEFEIGKGIRVPEGDHLWGPVFVGERGNLAHYSECLKVEETLAQGALTR